jgi:hypothetical protein
MANDPSTTTMLVRVQAKGGKFLGDDVGGAEVTIRDARTGEKLGGGFVRGNSGTLQAGYAANASQLAIVTPASSPTGIPAIQWLVPSESTSALTAELRLSHPTLLRVEVYGPMGGLQSAQRVVSTTWAAPGQDLDQGPGFVVELPGLVVQVQEPATHLNLSAVPAPVQFKVNVTMMCGCPIAADEPWLPGDFAVTAAVGLVGKAVSAPRTIVPLLFAETLPSLFTGEYVVTEPGYYQAAITAVQQSTGNVGTGTVTFFVTPPTS